MFKSRQMQNRQYACGPMAWQQRLYNATPVNITETENAYIVNLYAPALQKEAIAITTQNDVLTIRYKGEKDADATYTRREYRAEELNRSFDLKGKVAIDQIKASYIEGVLRIELPKTDAAKRPLQDVPVR
jgi:HSP20 family protein